MHYIGLFAPFYKKHKNAWQNHTKIMKEENTTIKDISYNNLLSNKKQKMQQHNKQGASAWRSCTGTLCMLQEGLVPNKTKNWTTQETMHRRTLHTARRPWLAEVALRWNTNLIQYILLFFIKYIFYYFQSI